MYIYNGKVVADTPNIKNTKKFKVTLEDVLLTFMASEIKGGNIVMTYSISYFNIPQNINEYEIESKIDYDSLRKVINDTVGELGKFVSIYSMSGKQVRFIFDARKFISHSTYPAKIISQKKLYQTKIKLNQKLPEIVKQTSSEIVVPLLSSLMTTTVRNDRKYIHIFKHMNSWAYSKNTILSAQYNIDENTFIVEIKDPYKLLYYYI